MREPLPNTSAFPMAQCEPCGKTVLTYVALDPGGDEARYCVHCDSPVPSELRWVSADELESGGYYIGSRPPASGGGCGSGGCGSCSARKS